MGWACRHRARFFPLWTSTPNLWGKTRCCCHAVVACFVSDLFMLIKFPKNCNGQFDVDCNYHFTVAFVATFGGNIPPQIEVEVQSATLFAIGFVENTYIDQWNLDSKKIHCPAWFTAPVSPGFIWLRCCIGRKFCSSWAWIRSTTTTSTQGRNTEPMSQGKTGNK